MKILILASIIFPSCLAFSKTPALGVRQDAFYKNTDGIRVLPKRDTTRIDAFRFGRVNKEAGEYYNNNDSLTSTVFDPATDVFFTALRIGTCALMIHHGLDKIVNVEGFSANVVAKFFGFLPGDPAFWTLSAAATQVGGSVLLAVGVLTRPIAFSMCITMLTAVAFHLLNTGGEGFPLAVVPQHSYNYELAAMYVIVLAYFSVAGSGPYSIDEKILGGELNLYRSLYGKINGDDGEEDAGVNNAAASNNPYAVNSKSFNFPWSKQESE